MLRQPQDCPLSSKERQVCCAWRSEEEMWKKMVKASGNLCRWQRQLICTTKVNLSNSSSQKRTGPDRRAYGGYAG